MDKITKRLESAEKALSTLMKQGDTVWSIYSADNDVELSNGRNDICPALSGDTRLVYRQTHGRMVVAKQPIKQGLVKELCQNVNLAF